MSSDANIKRDAKQEIDQSLSIAFFCVRQFGLNFNATNNRYQYVREMFMVILSFATICYHVFSELVYIGLTLAHNPKVEEVVPLFHTFGYGFLSIFKLFAIWSKRNQFKRLLQELVEIWPVPPLDLAVQKAKEKSLKSLRLVHLCYFMVNICGVWFYNFSPIVIFLYKKLRGAEAQEIGFVWTSWYPFDKYSLSGHIFTYAFEMFAGVTAVWAMIGSDLLFSGLANHIGMLLRLLHTHVAALATENELDHEECFKELVACIKLHQKLILYCYELEKAFTLVNLVNIVMSSVNICCVVFVIVLLEPFIFISNKLFLMSSLIQIGLICWYSDDIYHANGDVAMHAYQCGWYRTNPKFRKTLLFLIKRSQKPIAFTAMNFTNINLTTYSTILTRSYSYFALLYTMYSDNASTF